MKKISFAIFLVGAICLFCLFSCERSDTLYDVLTESLASEDLGLTGVLCYGRPYENAISHSSLCDCLGLSAGSDFHEKIEDFVLVSTLYGDYSEIAMIRLYRAADVATAVQLFERRIADAKKALGAAKIDGYAKNGVVEVKGNVAMLFMLPTESQVPEKIKGIL